MGNKVEVKVLLDDGAFMPTKAHKADAGYDIRTPYDFELKPGDTVTVETGVHMIIPEGYVGIVKSKSGLNRNKGITADGTIDAEYTGVIGITLRRDKNQKNTLIFEKGDKITQIVILELPDTELKQVYEIDETERGDGGFGSTGR